MSAVTSVPNDPLLNTEDYDESAENPLNIDPRLARWQGMGSATRNTLRYTIKFPGRAPFDSDKAAMRGLVSDGLVFYAGHGYWPTEEGVLVWEAGQR